LELGAVGGYKGVSDQIGDVYPDIWTWQSSIRRQPEPVIRLDSDNSISGTDLKRDGVRAGISKKAQA